MKYIDCDDGDESFDRMRDDKLTDAADAEMTCEQLRRKNIVQRILLSRAIMEDLLSHGAIGYSQPSQDYVFSRIQEAIKQFERGAL